MKVVVIGAAGHIGTYLVPMLADAGFETVAVTRTLSTPYEDAPAWHRSWTATIQASWTPSPPWHPMWWWIW